MGSNPKCLGGTELAIDQIGGMIVVIFIATLTVVVIVLSIIFMILKLNKKSNSIEGQIDRCQQLANGINDDDQKEGNS